MPRFTKQHYEAIANAIASNTARGNLVGHAWIDAPRFIDALVEMFDDDNPAFNASRFRIACDPANANTKEA